MRKEIEKRGKIEHGSKKTEDRFIWKFMDYEVLPVLVGKNIVHDKSGNIDDQVSLKISLRTVDKTICLENGILDGA